MVNALRSPATEERRTPPAPQRAAGALLAVLLLGQFMSVLDVSIVNVALPTLRADLDVSGAGLQLVVAGYTVAYSVLLITGARLGGVLGHRRAFHLGLIGFTLTSLACGLAPGTTSLIVFRFLQGASAALMTPQTMSLIQRNFTGEARLRAMGFFSAMIAGGVVVGQVAGGLLVSLDLFGAGWRTVFLVNVPVGLALMVAGPRVIPPDEPEGEVDLDLLGLVILGAAVLLFVMPLILGHELGWPAWTWGCLAASVVVFALFVWVERGLAARGRRPLLSVRMLRAPGLRPAAAMLLLAPATWAGFLFTTTLHLQGDLGMSALKSGLAFVPCVVAFGAVGLSWQRVPARWHANLIPAGFAVAAVAYLFVGPLADGGVGYELLTALIGFGLGVMSIIMSVALEGVALSDAADASGLLLTLMQLGQVVGVAGVGTVFLTAVGDDGSTRHAEYITGRVLAAVALVAVVSALLLVRDRRRGRVDQVPVAVRP
ncbi:MFS transporter [Parafrankia sp. EUN1f]|uniref:MFS transporter n=1 Tax=Parafrankia sp. EUN1f TaxID=102897 RepID=UPI0001C45561|nr:MFS transporter [Parafrankia sp. EUN1f]EFC86440.1 major facilitator superfamily MFS_1 [Parafrankia sp. EUN1f]